MPRNAVLFCKMCSWGKLAQKEKCSKGFVNEQSARYIGTKGATVLSPQYILCPDLGLLVGLGLFFLRYIGLLKLFFIKRHVEFCPTDIAADIAPRKQ